MAVSGIEAVRAWASDWSDKFDQGWDEEKLRQWVGKSVKLEGVNPDKPEGEGNLSAVAVIVGYSIDTLIVPLDEEGEADEVHRFSLVTSEGLQIALWSEMSVEEWDQE